MLQKASKNRGDSTKHIDEIFRRFVKQDEVFQGFKIKLQRA